jgi:mitochondrial fission protein ELM1
MPDASPSAASASGALDPARPPDLGGAALSLAYRPAPEKIVLEPRVGSGVSAAPPVKIFLGTEDSQHRAERIFLFSVEKFRDPSRTYEIYLMKNVRGFTRTAWRTNFTNYRFAIPDWAARRGKAIYNDVDQIYLTDPAELFDLDLGGHGYLSVSAEDTSVMLLDCARMASCWNLDRAVTRDKNVLLEDASSHPGLWGPLDPSWNARDLEYEPGASKCVHFTLLHTQPWMPSPDQYSYHPHPFGDVWCSLEEEADALGYCAFQRDRPSARFDAALRVAARRAAETPPKGERTAATLVEFTIRHGAVSLLACSIDTDRADTIAQSARTSARTFSPRGMASWPRDSFDGIVVVDLLEHLPSEDVAWVLDEIFARAGKAVAIRVAATEAQTIEVPTLDDPFLCMRPAAWWREQITHAARGRAAWRLETFSATEPSRALQTLEARSRAQATEPNIWVLLGVKGGDNAQAIDLAKAVGWRFETKQLRFNPLHALPNVVLGGSLANLERERSEPLGPPWPDIVISAGKRSVPVARWIQEQSGGRTRLVHIGRPWAPLSWFDLIITTPQYSLPARPNVLHNTLPLHSVDVEKLASAPDFAQWKQRMAALPSPYTVLLVGGNSPSYVLDATTAARLGAEASTVVRGNGGSLLVATSSRTSAEAADALEAAIDCPHHFHRFRKGSCENPYRPFLALAERFIVTGDSASMLAEACATGRPVAIYPVPRRLESLPGSKLLREGIWQWRAARTSYRGTPKQQDRLARFYDGLVVAGFLTPSRDLGAYHERLRAEGLATIGLIASEKPPRPRRRMDDMERAVERVRRVWTAARPVE